MENINKIKENLDTIFLGKNIEYFTQIDSTQDYIKNNKEENLPNGLVVLAENQTKGKGTNGRVWYTNPEENLTFSFLLKSNCNIKKIENLTRIIAEVIVNVIKTTYGYTLEIKYPNDIMASGKKLGGILTEGFTKGENVEKIIIGIGLNINQTKFPEEIKKIATSLKKEFKTNFEKEKILTKFLNEFEKAYLKLLEN